MTRRPDPLTGRPGVRATAPVCGACAGSGSWLLMNSMFVADGFRRERCHVCLGTGEHPFKSDREWTAFQAKARSCVKHWGGLRPPAPARPPE